MQLSDIPERFPIPFANGAASGFIRSIPTASQIGVADGRASLTDGFVPLNFDPVAAGGIPPAGEDFNGILFRVTGWARWLAAGGTASFNAPFAVAIGGYPNRAFLASSVTPGLFWTSTADNNTTDPDSGGAANWVALAPAAATLAEARAGTVTAKFINPKVLLDMRATIAEVLAATAIDRHVTPASLLLRDFTSGGCYELPGGFKIQATPATANGNGDTIVGWPVPFTTVAYGWFNGGNPSISAQDNNPYVSSSGLATATLRSAQDGAIAGTLFGVGI